MKKSDSNSRIIFFGTPEFSCAVLEALIKGGCKPIAAVTNPDAEAGRSKKILQPPVKSLALLHGISILQPAKAKDPAFLAELKSLKPDLFIIASYGKILPAELLAIPPHGTINVHPSLLPKHRGASPIQTAILNGDEETGVTLMLTDAEMDHGPILASRKAQIAKHQGYKELHDVLANLAGSLLIETLPKWLAGEITPQDQDHKKATFTKLFSKEDGKIDWNKSAAEIERQIRAFEVWPGSWTEWHDDKRTLRLRILDGHESQEPANLSSGTVTKTKSGDLAVATRDNLFVVSSIQPEGKSPMNAPAFVNGYSQIFGQRIG